MRQTIVICITNDIVFEETDKFLTRFYFIEENGEILFSKRACIICIELPKVNPDNRPLDELTPLEICLEYLKHADENGSEYVQALIRSGGKELEMTEAKLKRTTEQEYLREKALAREWFLRDEADRKAREDKLRRKEQAVEEQGKALEEQGKALEEQGKALEEQGKALEEQGKALEEKNKKLEEKDKKLEEKDKKLEEKDKKLALREQTFEKKIEGIIEGLVRLGYDKDKITAELDLDSEEINKTI